MLLALGVLTSISAGSPAFGSDRPATIVQIDGSTLQGTPQELKSGLLSIVPNNGDPVEIDVSNLLSIDYSTLPYLIDQASVVEFANGDRLLGTIDSVSDESLLVRSEDHSFAIPLERLRGVAFQRLSTEDGSAALLHREHGSDDLVLLTNGDRLAGQFTGLTGTELTIEADGRPVQVPRERIAAVAFSPELIARPEKELNRQIVQFHAGWLTVRDLRLDRQGHWQGTTTYGERVSWTPEEIVRIQFVGRRVELLSELQPSEEEFVPFLSRSWPVRENRSVTGESLNAGGIMFARGLGVHSRSKLTYELNGEYESFSVIAGLAASAGTVGCVEFTIEIDGEEVRRSPPITAQDPPFRLDRLDLTDAATMTLIVDYARNGDILDRANWCDGVLVRRTAPTAQ